MRTLRSRSASSLLRRLAAALAVVAVPALAAEPAALDKPLPLPFAAAGSAPAKPWRVVGLPQQTKPFTRFTIGEVEGVKAVRIEADKSYGNLVHPLRLAASSLQLSWQWRVDRPIADADLKSRRGDDMPVRVCVLFDMALDKVSARDRRLLERARSRSGKQVPSATICYVWDAKLAAGETLESPFTGRLRYVVVQSGGGKLRQWIAEKRDVAADFRKLFGAESDRLPPILGVAVGADADNTGTQSLAFVGGLVLEP